MNILTGERCPSHSSMRASLLQQPHNRQPNNLCNNTRWHFLSLPIHWWRCFKNPPSICPSWASGCHADTNHAACRSLLCRRSTQEAPDERLFPFTLISGHSRTWQSHSMAFAAMCLLKNMNHIVYQHIKIMRTVIVCQSSTDVLNLPCYVR